MGLIGCAAGGASGSALNGGSGWDVLKGSLMGAGMAMASYSMVWSYNNYAGSEISQETSLEASNVDKPDSPEGEFIADRFLKEANQILTDERNSLLQVGEDPMEYEAGASFRIRQEFWSGKDYLFVRDLTVVPIDEGNVGVAFKSYKGDHFRMHLHPKAGIDVGNGVTNPYNPSRSDYVSAATHQKYGIQSYAGAVRGTQSELYHYTYNNGSAKYWVASW